MREALSDEHDDGSPDRDVSGVSLAGAGVGGEGADVKSMPVQFSRTRLSDIVPDARRASDLLERGAQIGHLERAVARWAVTLLGCSLL
jgi:hypothetical protein